MKYEQMCQIEIMCQKENTSYIFSLFFIVMGYFHVRNEAYISDYIC